METTIAILTIGFMWGLILLSKLLKEEHTLLKLFFSISAVIMGVAGLGYGVQVAVENGSESLISASTTIFNTASVIQYLFFGYLIVYYIYKVLMYLREVIKTR